MSELEWMNFPCNWSNVRNGETTISSIINNHKEKLGEKTSIVSLFREAFSKDKSDDFVYDDIFWIQSKKDFILKAFLISDYIKTFEWKYIGIMLPSVSSSSLIIIATYLAGKVPVMLNWTAWEVALLHCAQFINISHILTSRHFYEKVKNIWTEKLSDKYIFLEEMLKNISFTRKLKAFALSYLFPIPKVCYEDEAVILFTSGSENLPKAVSLSHKNLISDILGSLYHFPIAKKDILVGFLPPFHSFWFTINTIIPLISGLRVAYTPDPNNTKIVVNLIEHTKATAVTATPTFLRMMLSIATTKNLKSLTYVVVWAEKCSDGLAENFIKCCPNGKILEWYWVTECSPVIAINPPAKPKLGSVWLPIYGSDVKIVSLTDKSLLDVNQEWMICCSWENVFSWYLNERLESPFEELNGKNYYKTGDLWYFDTDGYLYITGRLKRFVKIAGEMISLPFIEWIIARKYSLHTEWNIAVEALEEKGDIKIVLFSTEKIDLGEVSSHLRASWVSNLVKISEIITLSSIPVLGTWKIDYKELKKMITFEEKKPEYDFKDIEKTILRKLSELSKIPESNLKISHTFGKDIHLDSIDVGELSMFIKTYYRHIEYKDLKEIKTIEDLIQLIYK